MKTYRFLLFFLCFPFLFSCEDTLGCLIPKEPELENKEFPIATIEEYYAVALNAEINNEPRDDDYDYFFSVDGLPLGLEFFTDFRTISIEGVPEVAGTFRITIFVDVDGPFRPMINEEPEILCNYSTSKTYTIIVE
jgi:hypothetical protein